MSFSDANRVYLYLKDTEKRKQIFIMGNVGFMSVSHIAK